MAWIQDTRFHEMIIGREVIFNQFEITFIQSKEAIIFNPESKSIKKRVV